MMHLCMYYLFTVRCIVSIERMILYTIKVKKNKQKQLYTVCFTAKILSFTRAVKVNRNHPSPRAS